MATLTVPNHVESVRSATAFVMRTAREMKVPAADHPVFEVAVAEALANAVRHGRSGDSDRTITCDITSKDRRLTLRIIDNDTGFVVPPAGLPDISREPIEALPERGYGLPIIRSVFPIVRVVEVDGRFGIELGMSW
jgi:serine/threonine-protein kinase RsbW